LWEFEDEFGCHTGHRYSPDRLLHCQTEELEDALFVAIRLLTEKAALLRQVANKTQRTGGAARVLRHQADVDERHAGLIRAHLLQADPGPLADPDASEAAMAAIVAEMRRPMDD
jgi:two-component system chemotaxis response regulator CheB